MTARRALPQRRRGETITMKHGDLATEFKVTFGYFPDGSVGEVFVSGAKVGSATEAALRDGAILLSLSLQFGVPLDVIRGAITREGNGAPSTIIGSVIEKLAAEKSA